jgi:hypothetical protein
MRELNDVADVYMAFQNPDDDLWKNKPGISTALGELQLFNIKQTLSLFISAYYNLTESDFEKLVKACVVISFRYNIIGELNPNEQEDVYNAIAVNINKVKSFNVADLKSVYVLDENFQISFSNKIFKNTSRNHKIVKYILSKLERYKYRNDISADSDLYSIEHILPESADESWGDFDNEAINRSIYRIGNLTLLEKKLNKDAENLKYDKKKLLYKQSNCKLTTALVEQFEQWNESNLSARQKELAKDAKSIWCLQL